MSKKSLGAMMIGAAVVVVVALSSGDALSVGLESKGQEFGQDVGQYAVAERVNGVVLKEILAETQRQNEMLTSHTALLQQIAANTRD